MRVVEVLRVLGASLLALFSFKAGRDSAKKKELEKKVKDNDRLNRIRSKTNKLSRSAKLDRLRNK